MVSVALAFQLDHRVKDLPLLFLSSSFVSERQLFSNRLLLFHR